LPPEDAPGTSRAGSTVPIYLDNHATTRVDPRVVEAMAPYFSQDYGNAASRGHWFGWRAEAAVEQAREALAASIGASPGEIVFTSGATEADNLAVLGVARARRGGHVVASAIEHPAVLDPVARLAQEGFATTLVPVDGDGLVRPGEVAAALRDDTVLVSVMAANNEIGTLQPLAELSAICRGRGVPFHTDAAQAVGKVPFDVDALGVDLVSFCAHKLHGPKGVGALYVRRRRPRIRIEPLLHGGGHERGLRPGTLPVPLVVGFARAVALCLEDLEAESARLLALRERLRAALEKDLDGVAVNGHLERRLPGNLNLAFDGVDADRLLLGLRDVALSTGSACSSADPRPSHVLRALGLSDARVRGSVRFGIGRFNDESDIDQVAARVAEQVRLARAERPGAALRRRD
jgi:cysteine desulfurase